MAAVKRKGRLNKPLTNKERAWIGATWCKGRTSVAAMAEHLGCSRQTVYSVLHAQGIEPRAKDRRRCECCGRFMHEEKE